MKFGFTANPNSIPARAKSIGYDGVEISGHSFDVPRVRGAINDAGLEICCLASSVVYQRSPQQKIQAADDVRRCIDTASALGAHILKILGPQDRGIDAQDFGNWLLPLGDQASEAHVCIAVENTFSLSTAKKMWSMLDQMNHPAIGCCWILPTAVNAESPGISVPVLNSKIFYAKAAVPPPADPDAQPRLDKFVKRLNGIGYGGYLTIGSALDSSPLPEEILASVIEKWRSPARLL